MSALSFSSTNTLNVNATSAENIARLGKLLPAELCNPRIGIVCGSGLGTLAESITQRVIVPYRLLEGFGLSSGTSHLTLRGLTIFNPSSLGTSERTCVWENRGRTGSCDAWTGACNLKVLVGAVTDKRGSYKSSIRMKVTRSRRLYTRSVS